MTRRHDIDALRAIAFSLLILYHLAMLYVADWGWHLKSSYLGTGLQWPMLFVNRWRMDLIFLLSGLATAFMLARVPTSAFLRRRLPRLFMPLVFGVLVVVPVQPYCQGVVNGLVDPGFGQFLLRYYTGQSWPRGAFDGWEHGFTWNHLWYLVYLLVYTLLLAGLRPALDSRAGRWLRDRCLALRGGRLVAYPALYFLGLTLALQSFFPQTHDLVGDLYFHLRYFSVFVAGYWLADHAPMWDELDRLRKRLFWAALAVFGAYALLVAQAPDNADYVWLPPIWALRSAYLWMALLCILGWARAFLNRPFRWLPFANQAVYPWYILHQSLIVLWAYWLLPLKLGPVLEPLLILAGTVAGCWAMQVVILRQLPVLAPFLGMARDGDRRDRERLRVRPTI